MVKCKDFPEQVAPVAACSSFNVDLHLGKRLAYDGVCLRDTSSPSMPDGEYNRVVVSGGQIASLKNVEEVFTYVNGPCGEGSGGTTPGSGVQVAPGECNLLEKDAAGRLKATLVLQAGNGIEVSGCGTTSSPAVISSSGEGGEGSSDVNIFSTTPAALEVKKSGSTFQLKITSNKSGTYNGLTFNEYGWLTSAGDGGVNDGSICRIVAGPGIEVTQQGCVATLSGARYNIQQGLFWVGGWYMHINTYGDVTGMDQAIDLGNHDQEYQLGNYIVTLNRYGSVTAIRASGGGGSSAPATAWSTLFPVTNPGVAGDPPSRVLNFSLPSSSNIRIKFNQPAIAGDNGVDIIPRLHIDGVQQEWSQPENAYVAITFNRDSYDYISTSPLSAGNHTIELKYSRPGTSMARPLGRHLLDVWAIA